MKTKMTSLVLGSLLAVVLCAAKPGEAGPRAKTVPLPRCHVEAVDLTNLTFTVALHGTNLIVRITAQTRFFLYGTPALMKDLEVADHVKGTVRNASAGPAEAVRIHIEKLAPK